MMELKDYVAERIRVLSDAIALAEASEKDNQAASARRTFREISTILKFSKLELEYVMYYANNDAVHPELHPEWDGTGATYLASRRQDGPEENRE